MRWLGALVAALLAGGVVAAGAAAHESSPTSHLRPASTATDHAPFCAVPADALTIAPAAGGTLVTFTLVPPGCD